MNDAQLLRYSRHLLLEEIDVEGQERLLASHAVIIGAGGLGSPAALYLTSAGVGRLTLVDNDTVDLTNLQRQIAHTEARVGQAKTESMRTALQQINSETQIRTLSQRADATLLRELAAELTRSSKVEVGAQNVHFEKSGAFTGEISAEMLCELGVGYAGVGHWHRAHRHRRAGRRGVCGHSCRAGRTVWPGRGRQCNHSVRRQHERGQRRRAAFEAQRGRRPDWRRFSEG